MSVLDCILLCIGTIIIPGILYAWCLLGIMSPMFSKESNTFTSSDEQDNEESDVLKKLAEKKKWREECLAASMIASDRSDKRNNARMFRKEWSMKEPPSNSPLKLWLDGYEKNTPKLEWTPEEIKKFEEEAAKWREENKERIEAYDKEENQRLIDAINELEEYEKEHPNEKSMISSCILKWMVGWNNYEERLIKEGHSPSSPKTKPRISDIF